MRIQRDILLLLFFHSREKYTSFYEKNINSFNLHWSDSCRYQIRYWERDSTGGMHILLFFLREINMLYYEETISKQKGDIIMKKILKIPKIIGILKMRKY